MIVNFREGSAPAVFHHDLSVPGSWGNFEADVMTGKTRQLAPMVSETEDPRVLIEERIRATMQQESSKMADEVMRLGKQM